ncbi:MAG TPA: HDOD domain-containing protein [Gaiellales bacterium]|jgi:EAL and modified HD-GYP domain-containing signal transduction protein
MLPDSPGPLAAAHERAPARRPASDVERPLVARRPIFTRDLTVAAYELLTAAPAGPIGDERLAGLVISAVADVGLPALVGTRPAVVPVSRRFVERGFTRLLPAGKVVFAVDDELASDAAIAGQLGALAADGYRLLVEQPTTTRAFALAYIAAFDAAGDAVGAAGALAGSAPGPQLLARSVTEHVQVERLSRAGFVLFAGSFLGRPRPFAGGQAGEHRTSRIRLVAALQDPACDLETLDDVIRADAGMSYRLLRFVNSAHFSLPRHVDSVRDAVVLLGLQNVRVWASLLAVAAGREGPAELLRSSLVRARMAQLLARTLGIESPEAAFTVGLFSNLGVLLGVDLESALAELPLTVEVKAALLGDGGPLHELLRLVTSYETARFDEVPRVVAMVMGGIYVDALRYADGAMGAGLEGAVM